MSDEHPIESGDLPMVIAGERGIELRSFDDFWRWGNSVVRSGLAPKGLGPEGVMMVTQKGLECGLTPWAAVQALYPINGKVSWYAEAAMALVIDRHLMRSCNRHYIGERGADSWGYHMESARADGQFSEPTDYTVFDAKENKLWEKAGPWTEYPKDMLRWRCIGKHLRWNYPDALFGLGIIEEQRDIETRIHAAPRVVGSSSTAAEPSPILASMRGEGAPKTPEVDPETGETIPEDLPR